MGLGEILADEYKNYDMIWELGIKISEIKKKILLKLKEAQLSFIIYGSGIRDLDDSGDADIYTHQPQKILDSAVGVLQEYSLIFKIVAGIHLQTTRLSVFGSPILDITYIPEPDYLILAKFFAEQQSDFLAITKWFLQILQGKILLFPADLVPSTNMLMRESSKYIAAHELVTAGLEDRPKWPGFEEENELKCNIEVGAPTTNIYGGIWALALYCREFKINSSLFELKESKLFSKCKMFASCYGGAQIINKIIDDLFFDPEIADKKDPILIFSALNPRIATRRVTFNDAEITLPHPLYLQQELVLYMKMNFFADLTDRWYIYILQEMSVEIYKQTVEKDYIPGLPILIPKVPSFIRVQKAQRVGTAKLAKEAGLDKKYTYKIATEEFDKYLFL